MDRRDLLLDLVRLLRRSLDFSLLSRCLRGDLDLRRESDLLRRGGGDGLRLDPYRSYLDRLLLLDIEYLQYRLGDLDTLRLLGEGLTRRDLEYFLGDLPLSALLLEGDLCRLGGGVLCTTGDFSLFSAIAFFTGTSFFLMGGVSFLAFSCFFGERFDRDSRVVFSVSSFLFFSFVLSCFMGFFGLSGELSIELSDG